MLARLKNVIRSVNSYRRQQPLIFWLRVLTLAAIFALFITRRSFWTPDTLFLILLVVFIVFGQARSFLVRFAPFVILLLVYDSFRGIADDLNKNVHFIEMIYADRQLFDGQLPTYVLQQWWWNGQLQWYDFYFYLLYTLHFVVPLLLAVLIWKVRDVLYWPYVTALVVLSFMAFITYVVFPAAPPWMASDLGMIEPIHRISSDIWFAMGIADPSGFYQNLSPNAVAAVPSLHAAYPLLFVLFFNKLLGWRRWWWTMFYPASVWLGIVYLGEHYVIDAILGAGYALLAYLCTMQFFAWQARRPSQFKQHFARGYAWAYERVRRG